MTLPNTSCGVAVLERDRRASEGDERGVGQRVADVAGVAVEVVVMAAVRLVDDHDDVPPVGEQRVVDARRRVSPFGEAELLQRREVDAAGGAVGQFVPQLLTGRDLDGRLAEQPRPVERLEQLAVELRAVGHDDERRVLQLRLQR